MARIRQPFISLPFEGLLDQPKNFSNAVPSPSGFFSSGLRHLRTSSPGPAHFRCHLLNKFARFQTAHQILRYHDEQRHFAVIRRPERHHDAAAKLIAQLIGQRPHAIHIEAVRALRVDLHASLALRVALSTRHLELHFREFPFLLFQLLVQFAGTGDDFTGATFRRSDNSRTSASIAQANPTRHCR